MVSASMAAGPVMVRLSVMTAVLTINKLLLFLRVSNLIDAVAALSTPAVDSKLLVAVMLA